MPTAGKLVAGVLFAALFWYASTLAIPYYVADETPVPLYFAIIGAGLGLVLGWRIGGAGAGRATWAEAVSRGLTAGVAIAVCALFLHSFIRMMELSLRKFYDGPAEAVIGVFGLMFENALIVGRADVLATLVAGSVLIGIASEWTGRRFR